MMPRHWTRTLVAFSGLLGILTGTLLAQATYHVTDLGIIGGTASAGASINDISWVGGTSTLDASNSVIHASVWAYGRNFNLGTLGGPNSGILWPDHNIFGLISGVSETPEMQPLGEAWSCSAFFPSVTGHVCQGFAWRWERMTPLPTLGGTNGYAAGDNNLGQIVGWAETTVHDPTCTSPQVLQFEAAQWDAASGTIHQLPPLPGDPDGAATSINDRDQAVGISGLCYDAVGAATAEHMVLWEHGIPTQIPALGGNDWNTPTDINELGQVTGFADLPGDSPISPNFHAFFWSSATGTIDLGTLPGDVYSEGLGINIAGQVVGESCSAGFALCRAFIWEHGKMTDLNTLVAPTNLYLNFANDINDYGQITGGATDSSNGTTPGFLAVPQRGSDQASPMQARSTTNPPAMPEHLRMALVRRFGMKLSELK